MYQESLRFNIRMMGQMWDGNISTTWSLNDLACDRNEWYRVINGAGLASGWLGPYRVMIDRIPPAWSVTSFSGQGQSAGHGRYTVGIAWTVSVSDSNSGIAKCTNMKFNITVRS